MRRLAASFLALACLASCRGSGDGPRPPLDPAAQRALKNAAIAELGTSPEWEHPELVPGDVNTAGWEDSAYISRDGKTLWFQYFPGDLFRVNDVLRFHRPKSQGGLGGDPAQYDLYHRGPARGVSPAYTSDTFSASLEGGAFRGLTRFAYSRDGRNEWGVMQAEDGAFYYVTHDPTREMKRDIYRNAERLAIPGGDRYNEDNPHFAVTAYGRELFFDSDRPGNDGKNRIWITREVGGKFSEPALLASPVNVPGSTEAQPHLTADGRLFFTTTRDGVIAIDAARRTGENTWSAATRVLWPTKSSAPRVWAVGEPTLTADGQWLYFVAIFQNDRGEFDADVARVRRAASAAR
ncbi:MAG TPA: hypothetical protein VH040_16585 [Usitatibacter sp.]|jgi:hypothetical protein|nr:hypothetical protein [Usitatibacter sp.]